MNSLRHKHFSLLIIFILVTSYSFSQVKVSEFLQESKIASADNNKLFFVDFWATWCAPCKKELDAISDLYPDWEDDYNVKLLAISTDDARALPKVKPMVLEKDWPFTVLTDSNQELMRALQFQTVPQTFIIKDGAVVYSHSGYLPGDEDELEEELIKLSE